jgi:polyphosphate glucokinase
VDGPATLAVDVGGTNLKAAVLDRTGSMVGDQVRLPTPYPCPPEVLVRTLGDLVDPLPSYDRVSVGFPGMVRTGCVLTAPNLSRVAGPGSKVSADLRRAWAGVDLAGLLEETLSAPTRVVNDAEMQGAAVVRRHGLELVVTLGTGFGTGLFLDGRLAPHLELGQHPCQKDETYDERLGDAARKRIGNARWNRRVARAVRTLDIVLRFDRLFIGGGNSRRLRVDLGPNVELVDNLAGILGGIRLWNIDLTCDAAARPLHMEATPQAGQRDGGEKGRAPTSISEYRPARAGPVNGEADMQLGMIGLGRMGASLVRRLLRAGHECVVYDIN